jgi:Mn-containing catalase
LKTQSTDELVHAELVSNRISKLKTKAPSNLPPKPRRRVIQADLDPLKHPALRSALWGSCKFEGK